MIASIVDAKLMVVRSLVKIALQEMAADVADNNGEDGVIASTRRALEEAMRIIDDRPEEPDPNSGNAGKD